MVLGTTSANVLGIGVVGIVNWDLQFSYRQSRVCNMIVVTESASSHEEKWNTFVNVHRDTLVNIVNI